MAAAQLTWSVALIAVAALLTLAGAGLCLWALQQWMQSVAGPGAASLVTGLAALLLAGLTAWTARRLSR